MGLKNGEGNITTYDLMELMAELQKDAGGKVFVLVSLYEKGGKRQLWLDVAHDNELPRFASGRFTSSTLFWPSWSAKTFIACLYRGFWELSKTLQKM